MSTDVYPAARVVAPSVHAYFTRHQTDAHRSCVASQVPVPESGVVERLVSAAFWASLRREEGYIPRISLAYLPPHRDTQALLFERPLALEPAVLAKVAPVVERPGIHLGVWHQGDDLLVWGTTHTIPAYCFVLEVVDPGLLVVKHHRGERSGKYVNVAVLEGNQVKVVAYPAGTGNDEPNRLSALLGFDTPNTWVHPINVVVQLAVSMRAHGRGGLLLIVPSGTERWRESIVTPIPYAVSPPFQELSALMLASEHSSNPDAWEEALREIVDVIGGLTAVDGATVLTDRYELLAFGAKITRRRGQPPIERITVSEPVEGGEPIEVTPEQIGGTRHLSAAQFVHDQRDAMALVASQDRRFTAFAWSAAADQVHAHRVDALLL